MVEETAIAVRKILDEKIVPPPVNDKRCKDCSLKESCLPAAIQDKGKNQAHGGKVVCGGITVCGVTTKNSFHSGRVCNQNS